MKKLPKTTIDGTKIISIAFCSRKNLFHGIVETTRGTLKPVMWAAQGTNINRNSSNLNLSL